MTVVDAVVGLFISLATAALSFALPCWSQTSRREEDNADTWLVSQPPPSARVRNKEPWYFQYSAVDGGGRAGGERQPVCTMCL
jgi:hypothetical protein